MNSPGRITVVLLMITGFIVAGSPHPAEAQCVSGSGGGNDTLITFDGVAEDWIEYAVAKWNTCGGMGSQFPLLYPAAGGGNQHITVVYVNKHNNNTCGVYQPGKKKIKLWKSSLDAAGNVYQCSPKDTLAHEMGHVLDLNNTTCAPDYIMGPGAPVVPCSQGLCALSVSDPHAAECFKVKELWSPSIPPGCFGPMSEPVPTRSVTLRLSGDVEPSESPGAYRLNRVEFVDGISYLVDEWAVLEHRPGLMPAAVAASSSGFSREVQKMASTSELSSVALVVEGPVHPHNARHIQTPLVAWRDIAIEEYRGSPAWAAVRLDIGGNRLVRKADVLATSSPLPAVGFARLAIEGLDLTYFSEREHRVFVYLALEVRDGHLYLLDSEVILPLCCCQIPACSPGECEYCVP